MNKHSSNFKAKVALEAIKEIETIAEIGKKYNIHPRQVQMWKSDALKNFENLFVGKKILILQKMISFPSLKEKSDS